MLMNERGSLLDAAVKPRDAERQWTHRDFFERCGLSHHRDELFAGWEARGGRFEVVVCVAIAGERAAEVGQDAFAIEVVERAECAAAGLAEFEDDHAATRLDHARELGDAFARIADVADAER